MEMVAQTLSGAQVLAQLRILGVRQADLAAAMKVSRVRINQIVNGHAPITPQMALRLAKVTGTKPEFWLDLQTQFDLHRSRAELAGELEELRVLAR